MSYKESTYDRANQDNLGLCPIHRTPLEYLWKDQLDCEQCFVDYHEHIIEAMAHKMIEEVRRDDVTF